jgi:hypothetical protein
MPAAPHNGATRIRGTDETQSEVDGCWADEALPRGSELYLMLCGARVHHGPALSAGACPHRPGREAPSLPSVHERAVGVGRAGSAGTVSAGAVG